MIRFTVSDAAGNELGRVETASTDDLYNLRDEIHAKLETGEFGSEFPTFMNRVEPAEWSAAELPALLRELEAIAAAYRKLPPEPAQASMELWDEIEEGRFASLYEVHRDAAKRPFLGELIALFARAQQAGLPVRME